MDTTARDVMTTNVDTVTPDNSVREVIERLATADFNGFPVVDEDDAVVGIVTQGDLLRLFKPKDRVIWIPVGVPPFSETLDYAVDLPFDNVDFGVDMSRKANQPIREHMVTDVFTLPAGAPVTDVLDVLSDPTLDINRIPIVEDNQLVGIVTREDLLQGLRAELIEESSA